MEYLWFALLVVGMVGLWWVAYRMEPHWAAKDGRRFLCSCQDLSDLAHPGRVKEARVVVLPDGMLHVTRKAGLRRQQTLWRLTGRSPDPPRRKQVYLAERNGDLGREMLAIRLPANSRCVPVLDDLLPGGQRTCGDQLVSESEPRID